MTNAFAIGMFSSAGSPAFPALVIGDQAFALDPLRDLCRSRSGRTVLSECHSVQVLLDDWARNLDGLRELTVLAGTIGTEDFASAVRDLRPALLLRPGKILCAAANYKAHVVEMRKAGFTGGTPENGSGPLRPYHFIKASSCSVGAKDPIRLPGGDARIDWEVELAAVIGRQTKNATSRDALASVAGYAVCNDVSCRAATWRTDRPNLRSDWLSGKSYDTFFPLGPYLVPTEFVPHYGELQLKLSVNGTIKQDGVASDMIFSLEEQVEYLSAMLTLEPGDVIATGTPAGVGQGQGQYLRPGDVVEATISGLGVQRNKVVAPE
ncbi:fumarylacetoacetate hydrolase family protein [Bradyrhizobium sp. AUGA SZCCT0042]|uniref:fumarylacetoacetate hydrolase family protein n=1 Tax=Bradyrhizobium sp. AUGA SZCCT0042 TaxID=2807651 RepID=UPI001BAD6310|nr:fumarylacetoacetate hydrolase family protein [Bradyrhizobium sp. AUGA SZCCT0042]MBR1297369.1 fumarylacetoacetate hydrolase family protein [Bradyrhizobium sp. AUGA SZCCT0042]